MAHKIVIAGFGDTGVLTAAHLGPKNKKEKYDITAISTKPLLVSGQELGARLTRLPEWKENYLMAFSRFNKLEDVNIVHGRAEAIAPADNQLRARRMDGSEIALHYDCLIIASGTRNGFWRTDALQTQEQIEADLTRQSAALTTASTVAIIGGGPTAVSTASNLKEIHPDKTVRLYFPAALPLPGYAEKTRRFVMARLSEQGVEIFPEHRAHLPETAELPVLQPGTLRFQGGQADAMADCILWAVGQMRPNNDFIPAGLLTEDGYVRVEPTLQATGYDNIFAIGDIAATDPNRSSARNMGYQLLAKNIGAFLSGKPQKMKKFKAPEHRWGSVLGIQNEGLRIFTPKGVPVRVRPWAVKNLLYPLAVDRMIYKGVKRG